MKITDASIDCRAVQDRSTNGIADQASQYRRLPSLNSRPCLERALRLAVNVGADIGEVGTTLVCLDMTLPVVPD